MKSARLTGLSEAFASEPLPGTAASSAWENSLYVRAFASGFAMMPLSLTKANAVSSALTDATAGSGPGFAAGLPQDAATRSAPTAQTMQTIADFFTRSLLGQVVETADAF